MEFYLLIDAEVNKMTTFILNMHGNHKKNKK